MAFTEKKNIFFSSSLVIDTLREVDPSRKCFRLVGGVLVERTVKEVLPALETNKEQVIDPKMKNKCATAASFKVVF